MGSTFVIFGGPDERVRLIDQDGTKFHWRFPILVLTAARVCWLAMPFTVVAGIINGRWTTFIEGKLKKNLQLYIHTIGIPDCQITIARASDRVSLSQCHDSRKAGKPPQFSSRQFGVRNTLIVFIYYYFI